MACMLEVCKKFYGNKRINDIFNFFGILSPSKSMHPDFDISQTISF